jgi:hypothetical protein
VVGDPMTARSEADGKTSSVGIAGVRKRRLSILCILIALTVVGSAMITILLTVPMTASWATTIRALSRTAASGLDQQTVLLHASVLA